MRWTRIVVVGSVAAVLAGLVAGPALAQDRGLERLSERLTDDWTTWNPGGAPVSPAFVLAALEQGLSKGEVMEILESQALGGPRTSATFSSRELLEYFTENPDEIASLLEAVRSVEGAPHSYAEHLAAGGPVGAYRSYGQQLQEAVLAIGEARIAYLVGAQRVQAIAQGLDPRLAASAQHVAAFLHGTPMRAGSSDGGRQAPSPGIEELLGGLGQLPAPGVG
jgi:hypothetical protein